jgi:hypothetical protein
MLRRLDDRLSTMLGTCWDDGTFDADEKFRTLSAISYTENPKMPALIEVCTAFFGADSAEYFSVVSDKKIVVKKIPAKFHASECEIVPYEYIPSKGIEDKWGPHITAAYIGWLPVGERIKERISFNNTNEMLLQLCDAFIKEGTAKQNLIGLISRANETEESRHRDKQDLERRRRQEEAWLEEDRERKRVEDLIKRAVTDNTHLQYWIQEWKQINRELNPRLYPPSIKKKILDAIEKLM